MEKDADKICSQDIRNQSSVKERREKKKKEFKYVKLQELLKDMANFIFKLAFQHPVLL